MAAHILDPEQLRGVRPEVVEERRDPKRPAVALQEFDDRRRWNIRVFRLEIRMETSGEQREIEGDRDRKRTRDNRAQGRRPDLGPRFSR